MAFRDTVDGGGWLVRPPIGWLDVVHRQVYSHQGFACSHASASCKDLATSSVAACLLAWCS
jgi:hypothetical protein